MQHSKKDRYSSSSAAAERWNTPDRHLPQRTGRDALCGSRDICTTNRNWNPSEISIWIFMSVTLTYSRSYSMLDPRLQL